MSSPSLSPSLSPSFSFRFSLRFSFIFATNTSTILIFTKPNRFSS